jgi:hypothetical protein
MPISQVMDTPAVTLDVAQITMEPTKSFPVCFVFTRHSLVMASNSGDSSASALNSCLNGDSLSTVPFLHSLLYRTEAVASTVLLKHLGMAHADNTVLSCILTVSVGMCLLNCSIAICSCLLRTCRLATHVVLLPVSWPLSRNRCCFRAVC